uniref:DUF6821 domain-containing protein n=1 Tax=Hordeum vulgare subsp. vulgare TaxID=112509 RepID=A0A8I6WSX9_HORVV
MDSPVREMQEMDEFVLVPHAADLWSYQLDEDDDDHDARFLASNDEKTIDVNHFASEPTPHAAVQCGTKEPPAPSGSESEGSVDVEEEAVDGLLEKASDADEGGEVVADQKPECKDWEGDRGHGWQQHAVGVVCSVGLAAAATGLALLLGGHQQTPHKVHFRGVAGDSKVPKVSARRDERLDQRMSVPRFEHAPAMISFGGSYGGHMF